MMDTMTNEQLVARIQAGVDTAENMLKLWQQNRRYIYKLAMKYKGYEDMDDLQQEGYIGLCNAVQAYQPEEGVPFISYAAFWIRQAMQRYIEDCGTVVRIPVGRRQEALRYQKLCAAFAREYGREPADSEACRFLGVSLEALGRIKSAACMGRVGSLDKALTDEDQEATVGDLVPCDADIEGEILDKVQQEELAAVIWPLVDNLPGQQGAVLRMRYQEDLTLTECGRRLGMTAEGARQQHGNALREMRRTSRSRKLRPFLPEAERIYSSGIAGTGVQAFDRTWTSATERTALRLV